MGGETLVLWQRLVVGAIVIGLLALAGVLITIFVVIPGLKEGSVAEQAPALTLEEARQNALETYEAIQASATTTPPSAQLDAAIKAVAPSDGTTPEERQAALENYLGSQQ
ncbi:MAG: hypothetical protein AAB449_00335 [Patescibacteria group bacterium]